jgi:hypothetical protein
VYDGSPEQFAVRAGHPPPPLLLSFRVAPNVASVGPGAFYRQSRLADLSGLSGAAVTSLGVWSFLGTAPLSLEGLPPGLKRVHALAFAGTPLNTLEGLPFTCTVHGHAFGDPESPGTLCEGLEELAGRGGFGSVDGWVRGRRVRFAVLAAIRREREEGGGNGGGEEGGEGGGRELLRRLERLPPEIIREHIIRFVGTGFDLERAGGGFGAGGCVIG